MCATPERTLSRRFGALRAMPIRRFATAAEVLGRGLGGSSSLFGNCLDASHAYSTTSAQPFTILHCIACLHNIGLNLADDTLPVCIGKVLLVWQCLC